MAQLPQNKGLTGGAAALLGLVAFGAYQWRKQQRAKGTYDGNGDGQPDNAPTQTQA